MSPQTLVFSKNDCIGYSGAEEDEIFLRDCFIDNGDYYILKDCENPIRIVVGRTGSGKTALLKRLSSHEENIISIDPESLSMQYLSNSGIIQYLERSGVDLDLFYRLLWRHTLVVELIRAKYPNTGKKNNIITQLFSRQTDSAKQKALNYMEEWGDAFWEDTEIRVKQITEHLSDAINTKLNINIDNIAEMGIAGDSSSTSEQSYELIQKIQRVVNDIQIQKLSQVISLLADEVFCDEKKRYYLIIDNLDEKWVVDNIKYNLIGALIQTVRDFLKVRCAKIVISMRQDLLNHTFRISRHPGFQEEKYESLFLNIWWNRNALFSLVKKRFAALARMKSVTVGSDFDWLDLFPRRIDGKDFSKFLVERTHYRPRDIIHFINECIKRAEGKNVISQNIVKSAEASYSHSRLRYLEQEWNLEYPNIKDIILCMKGMDTSLTPEELLEVQFENVVLYHSERPDGKMGAMIWDYINGDIDNKYEIVNDIVAMLYKVGVLGYKKDSTSPIQWSYKQGNMLENRGVEVDERGRYYITPMFYRVLGVNNKDQLDGNNA